jgi:hypothetical protein
MSMPDVQANCRECRTIEVSAGILLKAAIVRSNEHIGKAYKLSKKIAEEKAARDPEKVGIKVGIIERLRRLANGLFISFNEARKQQRVNDLNFTALSMMLLANSLSAMPKDAKVSINKKEFACFFPGDSFAVLSKQEGR